MAAGLTSSSSSASRGVAVIITEFEKPRRRTAVVLLLRRFTFLPQQRLNLPPRGRNCQIKTTGCTTKHTLE